jgi:hypothetical protein
MAVSLTGLRTVIHPVRDLGAAKRWWSDFVGIASYFDEPFYVGFEIAGYELGLLPDARSGRRGARLLGRRRRGGGGGRRAGGGGDRAHADVRGGPTTS